MIFNLLIFLAFFMRILRANKNEGKYEKYLKNSMKAHNLAMDSEKRIIIGEDPINESSFLK